MYSLWDFFTDPVLRAPTLGSMLMCLSSSLVGVLVVIRKRSLLGEALSHAAYPGVVLSAWIFALFFREEDLFSIAILAGAFFSAWIGLSCIDFLQNRLRVKSDAALCFVLSSFFGVGILVASHMQTAHALWYKQIQVFLYGQAATMTDRHIWMYGCLSSLIVAFLLLFYREIQLFSFDPLFAKGVGVRVRLLETVFVFLLILAIVIGIRSVGVVLMSGMLIAPAVFARQMTHRLSMVFTWAAMIGVSSAFLGNYYSVKIPFWIDSGHFSLPTGPMILVVSMAFCIIALGFAPKKGLFTIQLRKSRFTRRCAEENVLKAFWKRGEHTVASLDEMQSWMHHSWIAAYCLSRRLLKQGWLEKQGSGYFLTKDGKNKAAEIVRLHRLWEVYLVHLGQSREKVHASAEEMEHVMTPELAKELSAFLQDPKEDPHAQPIPRGDLR